MKFILAALSLVAVKAYAIDPDRVYCKAYVYNDVSKKFTYVDLTQAKYDKDFLEGNVLNYGLGADKYFMTKDGGIGIVISDSQTHNGTHALAGWRTVAKTQMADLTYFNNLKDGSRDQITVSCFIDL